MAAPANPILTFGIPLKTPRDGTEKARIEALLTETLRSVYGQTDGDFRILLAAERRPDVGIPLDDRFELVEVRRGLTEGHQQGAGDAWHRRRIISELFVARGGGDLLFLDADDLVSRRLVAFVRETAHPSGYIFDEGYALDPGTGALLPLPHPRFGDRPFHHLSGTSSIIRFAPQDGFDENGTPLRFRRLHRLGHTTVAAASEAEGRPMMRLPFPGAIYLVDAPTSLSVVQSAESGGFAGGRRYLRRVIFESGIPSTRVAEEFTLSGAYRPTLPALTVAVTTYRRAASLRRLLGHLRPQVERRFHVDLVVVNDGSHDDAYEAVRTEFADFGTYRALPANVGIAGARNACVEAATGDYVVFIDDDCVPPPWWLDWLTARLKAAPELDVIAGTTRPLWTRGKRRRFAARVQAHYNLLPHPHMSGDAVLFVTANVAIRKSALLAAGGFGFPGFAGAGEDSELANRLWLRGARMLSDPNWSVSHEVARNVIELCRRAWAYGYGGGMYGRLLTAPRAMDSFGDYRRREHLRTFRQRFAVNTKRAGGFAGSKLGKRAAAFIATLVSLSYLDGLAAAVRQQQKGRVSGN